MIKGREKRRGNILNLLWDLIERMVGGRKLHRMGPAFLKALEFREVLARG